MADFTAKDIQALRQQAGVGMMDAKKALTDSGGDLEKAFELLRERGLAALAKRADRDATEGTIGSYLHVQNDHVVMGVLVELACETDFVAKSPEFGEVATDIAMHVSWANPTWVRREDADEAAIAKEAELIEREARAAGKPDQAIAKIVEGRIEKFMKDSVLYEQEFVNKEKFEGTVGDLVAQLAAKMGENISVRRVSRIAVGESA
ncbi:MAG: elongation factor Ts [Acidimicrobiia bacterium]|nr:elongation factor Ts [Acidimicrobiia bacterium]MDH4306453.1 elongation factor Ts [Acidimicrobiia bacterium]